MTTYLWRLVYVDFVVKEKKNVKLIFFGRNYEYCIEYILLDRKIFPILKLQVQGELKEMIEFWHFLSGAYYSIIGV